MSEYFFARECVNSPIYCFPDEYIDSVPLTSFTYPIIDMCRILEGCTRNAGKHAGGVVISPTTITDFAALYCDDDSRCG